MLLHLVSRLLHLSTVAIVRHKLCSLLKGTATHTAGAEEDNYSHCGLQPVRMAGPGLVAAEFEHELRK